MSVHEWASGVLKTTLRLDRNRVLSGLFISENEVVTCGVRHIKLWNLEEGSTRGRRIIFGKQFAAESRDILVCLVQYQEKLIAGSHKGALILIKEGAVLRTVPKAHSAQITSLLTYTNTEGAVYLISGGHDGSIKVWDYEFAKPLVQVDLKVFL